MAEERKFKDGEKMPQICEEFSPIPSQERRPSCPLILYLALDNLVVSVGWPAGRREAIFYSSSAITGC